MTDPIPFAPRVASMDPDPEVVDRLRKMLARAESGELRGIAYAFVRQSGCITRGWIGSEGGVNQNDVIAAVAILQYELIRESMDRAVDSDD